VVCELAEENWGGAEARRRRRRGREEWGGGTCPPSQTTTGGVVSSAVQPGPGRSPGRKRVLVSVGITNKLVGVPPYGER